MESCVKQVCLRPLFEAFISITGVWSNASEKDARTVNQKKKTFITSNVEVILNSKMQSSKIRRNKRTQLKKEKLSKLIKNDTDSDGGESEHELAHYLNDRVKLMKEVLKIIKPKKIKTMAPDCMQRLDIEEINSMLLDELLGISNKRLRYIFNGQTLNEESSSTDPEEEQPIDIISLDDISDDEFIIDLDSDAESKKKHKRHKHKIKEEPKKKRVKKEKPDKIRNSAESQNQMSEQNLMSVLELLELQARARAIRSQLVLENTKKAEEAAKVSAEVESSDNEDAVIVESPENVEIIITSSDSENEHLQEDPNHQFRKSTDDSPEKNSKEAEEVTQKSITDGKSESTLSKNRNVNTKITQIGTEVINKESNIGVLDDASLPNGSSDQSNNDPSVVNNEKETDTISNEEETIGVVHIPLPKEKNDQSAAAVQVSTEKITRESREQQAVEITKNSNDNLKRREESENNALPVDSNEKGSKDSKSFNEENRQTTEERSEKKLLKGSEKSNSEACSSKKNIPHSKLKTTSQEVEVLTRNVDGRSKGLEDENTESNTNKDVGKPGHESKKGKGSRICRRKLSKLAKEKKADNLGSIQKPSVTSRNQEKKSNKTDESDGIILNVDQSEMDCIHLD